MKQRRSLCPNTYFFDHVKIVLEIVVVNVNFIARVSSAMLLHELVEEIRILILSAKALGRDSANECAETENSGVVAAELNSPKTRTQCLLCAYRVATQPPRRRLRRRTEAVTQPQRPYSLEKIRILYGMNSTVLAVAGTAFGTVSRSARLFMWMYGQRVVACTCTNTLR